MAANVAMEHTTMELYCTSTKGKVKGKRNNNNPVSLFGIVCRDSNCLLETYPHTILPILIIAIPRIHSHNHGGIVMVGNSFIKATVTNTRSAAVSILAPHSPALFVFLAIVPSIISLKPQMIYMTVNSAENAGKNNSKTLPNMRQPVTIFATCFIICSPKTTKKQKTCFRGGFIPQWPPGCRRSGLFSPRSVFRSSPSAPPHGR